MRTAAFISELHGLEQSLSQNTDGGSLTPLQHYLLRVLYFASPKTLSSLSECMNINLPNASREVKKLVEHNLITKIKLKSDKRITELSLTDEGKRRVESVLFQIRDQFFETTGEWSEHRSRRLIESLNVIEEELLGKQSVL